MRLSSSKVLGTKIEEMVPLRGFEATTIAPASSDDVSTLRDRISMLVTMVWPTVF